MKKVAILTTGGDAPGINAAIVASVKRLMKRKVRVFGVFEGYEGLIHGRISELGPEDVENIQSRGGTMLRSSRSAEFKTKRGRRRALKVLETFGIEALIVIGGNGSLYGAGEFYKESGFPVVGIPKTIDNDVAGTDYCIGFDTALNNAVEAIDKIRESATSHNRVFFIEVMGRDAGHLALYSGIATASEVIMIPETWSDLKAMEKKIRSHLGNVQTPMIVIVAEGDDAGHARDIIKKLKKRIRGFNPGLSVLGYIQRGGSPSVFDRYLGTAMGEKAARLVLEGKFGIFTTYRNGKIDHAPLRILRKGIHKIDPGLLRLARDLGQMV